MLLEYLKLELSTKKTKWTTHSSFTVINREFSICTMDGFSDFKTSNVASSIRRLSDPLRIVELRGPTDDKLDACTHECNWHSNRPRIIRRAN